MLRLMHKFHPMTLFDPFCNETKNVLSFYGKNIFDLFVEMNSDNVL